MSDRLEVDKWSFVTESSSWFVWRKDGAGYSVFKNLNKHTGEIVIRRLTWI